MTALYTKAGPKSSAACVYETLTVRVVKFEWNVNSCPWSTLNVYCQRLTTFLPTHGKANESVLSEQCLSSSVVVCLSVCPACIPGKPWPVDPRLFHRRTAQLSMQLVTNLIQIGTTVFQQCVFSWILVESTSSSLLCFVSTYLCFGLTSLRYVNVNNTQKSNIKYIISLTSNSDKLGSAADSII